MLKTTDFIDSLMNRNNDELDDILSYADKLKEQNGNENKVHESAEDILAELDGLDACEQDERAYSNQYTRDEQQESIAEDVYEDNEGIQDTDETEESEDIPVIPDEYDHTSVIDESDYADTEVQKEEESVDTSEDNYFDEYKTQLLTIPENFHHVLMEQNALDFVSYKNVMNDPAAQDADGSISSASGRAGRSKKRISDDNYQEAPDYENDAELSDSEKFMEEQGLKHPKFYFIIGISIALLTLLGLLSLIYLGISFLRSFTGNYTEKTIACIPFLPLF